MIPKNFFAKIQYSRVPAKGKSNKILVKRLDQRKTLKVNRSCQTTTPLQRPRREIQTKGKNKEDLPSLTVDNKHKKQPRTSNTNSFVTSQHNSILQEG